MTNLIFWNRWNSPYRQLYWFLFFVFCISLVAVAVAWAIGHDQTIQWTTTTKLEPSLVGIYDFSRNFFSFSVPGDTYLASDNFSPAPISPNPYFAYFSLLLIAIGFVWVVSIISFFELYWYMGGMLALLGFCASLNLDILEIAGRTDRIPLIILFMSYGGLSYYFNSFGKHITLLYRLIAFALLTVACAIAIGTLSRLNTPFLYLAAYSSFLPLWTMLLVILLHGHYILKAFVYLVAGTARTNQGSSLMHFGIAAALYLVSLALLLMKHLMVFELNIVYLHPFLVFLVSSMIGIWQFRKQSEQFGSALPFVPAGAMLYLALVIIAAAGLSYACITDNFGWIQAYERFMLYGYLFTGFVFVIYVLANFGALFNQRISIYDEIYNSNRLGFYAVPAMTIIIAGAFFMYQKKYPYHLAKSGYYTIAGDVYFHEKQFPLAFQYYSNAISYDYPNPRANYSIAALSHALGDYNSAVGYYENALIRNPNAESYVGAANALMERGEYFQAVFKLQEGLQKFPNRGELLNNLGVAFSRTSLTDSTIHYLNKAAQEMSDASIPHSNILYVLNKKGYAPLADSLSFVYKHSNISFEINRTATNLMNGKKDSSRFENSWIKDSTLNELQYAYIWNYTMMHSDWDPKLLSALESDTTNAAYESGLEYLQAWQYYRQGNAAKAITILENLIAGTTNPASFARTLGYWMLEQDAYKEAERAFLLTGPFYQFDDALNLSLVQMRLDQNAAKETLGGLMVHPDSSKRPLAAGLMIMLNANFQQAQTLPPALKVLYAALNAGKLSDTQILQLQNSLPPDLGATIWADRLEYYAGKNDMAAAANWFKNTPEVTNPSGHYAISHYAFMSEQPNLLKTVIDKEWSRPLLKSFYRGWLAEKEGKLKEAGNLYLSSLKTAPMYGYIYAPALTTMNKTGLSQVGYDLVVEAIRRSPDHTEIQVAFLEQCLYLGYTNYAETTLAELKGKIAAAEATKYRKTLDSLLQ